MKNRDSTDFSGEMITIRPERPEDHEAIRQVTKLAFTGKPYAAGNEQEIIDRLRAAGALALSLVAVETDNILGQISFSPAQLSSGQGGWFALGPISVVPERQHEGIGITLIEAGIAQLAELDACGCIVVGDPRYYSRHGFKLSPRHCSDKEFKDYFQLRLIGEAKPSGTFTFHPVFYHSP